MKKITVTKKHIKNGRRYHPYDCPIALALKDAGFRTSCVYLHEIITSSHEHEACWQYTFKNCSTSKGVKKFIKAFDSGKRNLKPFSFFLKVKE